MDSAQRLTVALSQYRPAKGPLRLGLAAAALAAVPRNIHFDRSKKLLACSMETLLLLVSALFSSSHLKVVSLSLRLSRI